MSTILEHAQSGISALDGAKDNLVQNFATDNPALAQLHDQIDSAKLALSEIEKLAEVGFSGSIESGPVSEAQLDATAPPTETTPGAGDDESVTTEQATSDAAPDTTPETTA